MNSLLNKYNSGDVPYISVQELRMHQLDEEVVILDSRNSEEFQVSHLKNSVFVGYDNFDISSLKSIRKDQKIVVYCSVGIRSENIADKIITAGFTNVQNLYGGIFKWKNEGFPVVDLKGIETEKVHVFSKHWAKYLNKGEKIY
ncbi:rhodanese-like domain-containing protein [Gramella sp. ASW11-100T]|uniref:Rhodanese-like domain-containing protein n=2 Tax=Christiangramia sediminis TaxID=2881336 RepID=A0A9X1LKY7_9FLAO|nr:rhodanese-like domain-containing protein [Christiangramia sediminis]